MNSSCLISFMLGNIFLWRRTKLLCLLQIKALNNRQAHHYVSDEIHLKYTDGLFCLDYLHFIKSEKIENYDDKLLLAGAAPMMLT